GAAGRLDDGGPLLVRTGRGLGAVDAAALTSPGARLAHPRSWRYLVRHEYAISPGQALPRDLVPGRRVGAVAGVRGQGCSAGRVPKQAIVDYLERAGMRFGADANASTSFDETIYTFTVPTDDAAVFAQALVVLEQIAHDVSFDPGEVGRERGVILEERRLGL